MGLIHFCYDYNYDYDYNYNYDYNFGCWLLAIGYQQLVTHLTILHLIPIFKLQNYKTLAYVLRYVNKKVVNKLSTMAICDLEL